MYSTNSIQTDGRTINHRRLVIIRSSETIPNPQLLIPRILLLLRHISVPVGEAVVRRLDGDTIFASHDCSRRTRKELGTMQNTRLMSRLSAPAEQTLSVIAVRLIWKRQTTFPMPKR